MEAQDEESLKKPSFIYALYYMYSGTHFLCILETCAATNVRIGYNDANRDFQEIL